MIPTMIYGYARVSTDGQTLDAQLAGLKAAGVEKVYQEKVSGAQTDRKELGRMLAALSSGDQVIVTRLDRLARSSRDLLNILATITTKHARFRSLADTWADTTTSQGRLLITILGGLAEFERDLIKARTQEGRALARARGKRMGRPFKLTSHQRQEIHEALASGEMRGADLARRYGVSQTMISRMAKPNRTIPHAD
jgi:DNA invertase Pin-like site-specific DNA recombinase